MTDLSNDILPVLVVDDDEVILLALEEIMRDANLPIVTANSPDHALKLMEESRFSVIVSDQRMPTMNGITFLKRSIEHQPHAVRILTTGVLNIDTVIQAVNESHIYRFLPKPWMRDDFITAMRDAIEQFESFHSLEQLLQETLKINEELSTQSQ